MEFLHVGMKVNDIHKSMELYRALFGIKWEPVKEYTLTDATLNGKVTPSTTRVTHGLTASGFEIEMIQVVTGQVPDNLVVGDGEGLTHFAFQVADLETVTVEAERLGLRPVSEYRSAYVDYTFFAAKELGGPLTQLVHLKQPRKTYYE